MKAKPVVPRERARRDVDAAVDYYAGTASRKVALGFIDALEVAYRHIARHPATGSPRYGHELDLPGLRSWPLKRYPHIVISSKAKATSMSGASCTPRAIFQDGCGKQIRCEPVNGGFQA